MPQLGLGVWRAADGDEVEQAVAAALKAGYRLIDTAAVYQNEAGVGKAIKESGIPREEIFVTTKLWNSDQAAGNIQGGFETSLQKLGLDYVDLYLIHWPMPAIGKYAEAWLQFEKLLESGKTRAIGVSNFQIEHLEELKRHSSVVPAVNQIELHPYFPQTELRKYAKENGIRIESWSPIGHGEGLLNEAVLRDIGDKYSKTPAQVVIRWHLQNGLIVIPKSVHAERIRENCDVFDFELSAQDMQAIDGMENGQRRGPDPDTMNNH
jgi:diketogulonate reductase-like aldo/keto reductase